MKEEIKTLLENLEFHEAQDKPGLWNRKLDEIEANGLFAQITKKYGIPITDIKINAYIDFRRAKDKGRRFYTIEGIEGVFDSEDESNSNPIPILNYFKQERDKILGDKALPDPQTKTIAKISDQDRDDLIERAKAKRFLERQGSSYSVSGKERPDAAMIQKIANEVGISVEILEAEQTEKHSYVKVRGHKGNQYVDAVVHHDFDTIFPLKIMEIVDRNPAILDHFDGLQPVIKEGAQIPKGNRGDYQDAKYFITHSLLAFKNFSLRDATTKASSIVQMKLLNQDFRDEEEKQSEKAESDLVAKLKATK